MQVRNYIANALKILTANTAALAGAKSGAPVSYLTKNLFDLTQEKKPERSQQSGQEIASGIIRRLTKKE